ncbi:MAG: putative ABC transporter permease [Clostridia bacterium]|nr:putative ABC transporter permease [Clostridia bacterium]
MNIVEFLLVAAFLFFIGSVLGWCLEVLFRRFCSAKKWINPGFLTGPYLPLYGFGLAGLFGISLIPVNTGSAAWDAVIIIALMGITMTVIEYIAGLIFIKGMKIRLWDYSNRWGNIQGIICPLFSLFWLLISVFFYFVIDPFVIDAVVWFVNNMAFAFVVGLFFGVFFVDLGHSINISAKIRKFAKDKRIVVSLEKLKENIKDKLESVHKKPSFVFPFKSGSSLDEQLQDYADKGE